jgi:hypothetical protein
MFLSICHEFLFKPILPAKTVRTALVRTLANFDFQNKAQEPWIQGSPRRLGLVMQVCSWPQVAWFCELYACAF